MTDDRGVLGNLPRTRPGQRSEKRSAKADAAAKPARSAPRKTTSRAKPRATRPAPSAGPPPPVPEDTRAAGGNPIAGVVRTGASLAGAGSRAARGVAREVLRRLPRP